MRKKSVKKQVRLTIASNAGGSGKTTMAVHLAYAVGLKGYKVTLIELDQNASLRIFARLDPASYEDSVAAVLKKGFKGDYPITPLWSDYISTVTAIQGGKALEESVREVYLYDRRHYTLKDRLDDYPLRACQETTSWFYDWTKRLNIRIGVPGWGAKSFINASVGSARRGTKRFGRTMNN